MNIVGKEGGWAFLRAINPTAFTWNPGSGCEVTDCLVRPHCWAKKIVQRLKNICPLCPTFKPHLHDGKNDTPDRLMEAFNRKKSAVITPVSTGDLFGLKPEMTNTIMDILKMSPWHIFMLLTKAPHNAQKYSPLPQHIWMGTTVNEQTDTWRLDELKKINSSMKWAIFEPLYHYIQYDLTWLDWIVIGPQTNPMRQPKTEWVKSILDNAHEVPVFMKHNLDFEPFTQEGPHYPRSKLKEKKNETK